MLRKHFKIVCLALAIVALVIPGVLAKERIVFQDDFDSYTPDAPPGGAWTGVPHTSRVVEGGADGSANALKINDLMATNSFEPITDGKVVLEFWTLTEMDMLRTLSFCLREGENPAGPYLTFTGQKVRYHVGEWKDIGKFKKDTWYFIRITADLETSLFDFEMYEKLDGKLIEVSSGTGEFQNPQRAIDTVWFSAIGTVEPWVLIDQIVVKHISK